MLAATVLSCGCHARRTAESSRPMPQRGYLWQRDWSPAVATAFTEADARLDGVVVLGGEIVWDGSAPRLIRAAIQWDVLAAARKPTALALRVAPFAGPFQDDDAAARYVTNAAESLLHEAAEHGVTVSEFQLDFDCAQQKLAGYRLWVKAVGAAIRPLPLVLTALPSWLDQPEFPKLIDDAQSYVLQVHSVPLRGETPRATLCDAVAARQWARKAGALGRPFAIALPTYRCLAGYAPDGKLLAVAMDSVQPAWPAGTRVLEFSSDAEELARLVGEWRTSRPAAMRELIWYRVPTNLDRRNWRWPTLAAVMAGREPTHKLELTMSGENPVDVSIVNHGEAEEAVASEVKASWNGATLVASDALEGWAITPGPTRALFTPDREHPLRLLPGERRDIGWLRYEGTPELQLQFAEHAPIAR